MKKISLHMLKKIYYKQNSMLSCKVNEQQKALQLVVHSVKNITFCAINKL